MRIGARRKETIGGESGGAGARFAKAPSLPAPRRAPTTASYQLLTSVRPLLALAATTPLPSREGPRERVRSRHATLRRYISFEVYIGLCWIKVSPGAGDVATFVRHCRSPVDIIFRCGPFSRPPHYVPLARVGVCGETSTSD